MSDVYLIKKETLTAIADVIRENICEEEGYEIPQTITPETMPDNIGVLVAESNFDMGYGVGYDEGYINGEDYQLIKNAPLIAQGNCDPRVVDNFNSAPGLKPQMVMYDEQGFNYATVGMNSDGDTINYCWWDDIDYEIMISGSTLTLGVTNHSDFYVDVFLNLAFSTGTGNPASRNVVVSIDPHSSGSYGETFNSTVKQGDVNYIAGFLFKGGQNGN